MNLDKTYCTNKEYTKECDYKLTLEIEAEARLHGKLLSLCKSRCEDNDIIVK